MNVVLMQMAVLIACGLGWQWLRPGGLDPRQVRTVLTASVYYLFLPALVLHVIWLAPLGINSAYIAFLAAVGVVSGIGLAWLAMRMMHVSAAVTGACILAAAWPNASYLGLPVLEAVFGDLGRSTAIQYDLFACTPLLLTLGIFLARHYGNQASHTANEAMLPALLKVPPLWAALMAVIMNSAEIAMPGFVDRILSLLGHAVVPLMLFSLGLGLSWQSLHWRRLPPVLPVLLIQLILMPLIVWFAGSTLPGLQGRQFDAIVMEAALPSMVLGLVFCDRYRLDTGMYATAVTLTTLASMLTMPVWYGLLVEQGGL